MAAWLEQTLGVSQQQLAALVGTSTRTWQRWLAGSQPDADQLGRLRRLACLAMHLRHALDRAGRYNRAGSGATQYVCLHPWGPWAELLRGENRRTAADAADLGSRVWSVRVALPGPPRRITFDDAAACGVTPDDLVGEDYSACQDLAEEARGRGELALVVPSAALPGTEMLVLLGPRVLVPWQLPPVDVALDVPAAVTAERAGPPLAVLPHIRRRGDPHRGLADWRAGRGSPFLEPVPTPV